VRRVRSQRLYKFGVANVAIRAISPRRASLRKLGVIDLIIHSHPRGGIYAASFEHNAFSQKKMKEKLSKERCVPNANIRRN